MNSQTIVVYKLAKYIKDKYDGGVLTDYYNTTKGDYVLKYINQQNEVEVVTITKATYNAILERESTREIIKDKM